jgi:PAS domain S-box-containing protein
MNNLEAIQVLGKFAVSSEYFLQVTIDKSGNVLSSDSGLGPVPSLFDKKEKPLHFSDCFLSSEIAKYENQRIKAWRNSHQSFIVDLQKINYLEGTLSPTKWEFFFISEDFGTCLGIGHLTEPVKPYNIGLGELFDRSGDENELVDSLLEDKLLGFWEFDYLQKADNISQGLAQMLGYSQEEATEKRNISWQNHIHPEDYSELVKDLSKHFQTPGNLPFRKEFRIFSKGNETFWVLGYGKTIQWSEEGKPIRILGCIFDISEKKKQQLWLLEHHFFLKDLAFQQSHSLRARVANILGILEILDTEHQSTESKKLVHLIKNETKQLDAALKKSIKESVQENQSFEKDILSE